MLINQTGHRMWVKVIDNKNYEVSDFGFVRNSNTLKIIKQRFNTTGYKIVDIYFNGIRQTKTVHRLVYESFNGKTCLNVDHIKEGDKSDNRHCNLQAISNRANVTKYHLSKNRSSKFTGVRFKAGKWEASIRINGVYNYLGSFFNETDASNAYQNKLNSSPTLQAHK